MGDDLPVFKATLTLPIKPFTMAKQRNYLYVYPQQMPYARVSAYVYGHTHFMLFHLILGGSAAALTQCLRGPDRATKFELEAQLQNKPCRLPRS